MGKIFYFGYGANQTLEMMGWITGTPAPKGKPAIINGWILCVQKLNQVPTTVIPTSAGPRSLREHLRIVWGDKFETYVITPGKGKVQGTLWELTQEDRDLVKNWERVGVWYKEVKVKATGNDGLEVEAVTECLGDNQSFDRKVNGLEHEPFLFSKAIFKARAEQARQGYYKRLR